MINTDQDTLEMTLAEKEYRLRELYMINEPSVEEYAEITLLENLLDPFAITAEDETEWLNIAEETEDYGF